MAAQSILLRTGSCTSLSARTPRSYASMRMERFPRTIPSSTRPGPAKRSGRWDFAIPLPSRFSQAPRACSLTTSARAPGKRLMTVSPDLITDGQSLKGRHRIQGSERPCLPTVTAQPAQRAVLLPAELFTTPLRCNSRPAMPASISSPICVVDGFAYWIHPTILRPTSPAASPARLT